MPKEKKEKNKYLFLTEYFPSERTIDVHGGVEARTYHLARELAKKNLVTVVCSQEKGKPRRQSLNSIKIIRVGPQRLYQHKGDLLKRLAFVLASIRICLKSQADLIEGTGFLGQIAAFPSAKIKRIPCLAFIPDTFSSFSHYFNPIESFFLKIFEKILFNRFWDGYIVISSQVKKKLEAFKVNKDKIKIIYCPVVTKTIKKIPTGKTSYSSLVVINRLVSYKRTQDILKAVSLLKVKFPDIKCQIVGDGEEIGFLKKLSRNLNIAKNVVFYGFVKDHQKVLEILKRSWIFCSASLVEGFGITTVEAMATETPFVIADTAVNREITKGYGGLFFERENCQDLANKLFKIIQNKKYAKSLISNNEKIIKKYDIKNIAYETESYYLSILNS